MSDAHQSGMDKRIETELDDLRERAQFRTLENPTGINLYSNDYLGLSCDSRLKRAVLDAVAKAERIGATGSRLLSGNSREWEEIEAEFAEFAGAESGLYFGSGYTANVGLIAAVAGRDSIIFSDELNHASLIDGIRLSDAKKIIYPHRDAEFVEYALRQHRSHPGAKLIVTESVFSMEGDIAPLGRLLALASDYGASLIVDEAHATGVHGPQGRGICAQLGCERDVFAIVHTCGKALASVGAFVCGSSKLRDYLVNRARTFIFSTAMPAYMSGQIRAALQIARGADDRRAHLHAISSDFRHRLGAAGIDCGSSGTQIVSVRLGGNEAALSAAAALQSAGFAVRAIRPPTVPAGTSRIRFSLTALLSFEDVTRLTAAIDHAIKPAQVSSVSANG